MKALEICRRFYEEEGRPALEAAFPELLPRLAAGLVGGGSDCLGYDDELSRDHDLHAGFQIFLSREDFEASGFALSALYDRLPGPFLGLPTEHRSRMGDGRLGVKCIGDFYRQELGSPSGPESWQEWMALPSWALCRASSGAVFEDGPGDFSRIREKLLRGMPEDVRLKKLAAQAALTAQAGQYNYFRCLRHGEEGGALLAAGEFVRHALSLSFLLARRHMPFYKWAFRAMEELPGFESIREGLLAVLRGEDTAEHIEAVSGELIRRIRAEGLSGGSWDYLEPHAREIMKHIENPAIRALHLMEE